MAQVTTDRSSISPYFKATVTVTSETPFYALEARATRVGEPWCKGVGLCLLSDDVTASNGEVALNGVTSFTFDIESTELNADGNYKISVYTKNADGVWNDTAVLYTSFNEKVKDSTGKDICVKRNGSGTDESYVSAYSGSEINNFIAEVLNN